MSELINARNYGRDFRWQLLTTVSSLALLASVCAMQDANAEESDRPVVWIELGTDLDRVDDGQQSFAPAFIANNPGSTAFAPVSPLDAEKPPRFSFGGESKILIQPEDSNWIFAASIRYGRSNGTRHVHQTAKNKPYYEHFRYCGPVACFTGIPPVTYTPYVANFLDVAEKQSETHAILDFMAGKDVGLGFLGREGTSVWSAGVRFAQFTARMQSKLIARPDNVFVVVHLPKPGYTYDSGTVIRNHYHQYVATAQSARSFHGIGPSLSWNASVPFLGSSTNGELSLDWGVNAAVLFGRQKAVVQHQASAYYVNHNYYSPPGDGTSYQNPQVNRQRTRSILVPNVGGFAGVTFGFTNVKVSAGYRGDFFFGAMDTGFDTAKKSTIGFYGPFASISIGIGG